MQIAPADFSAYNPPSFAAALSLNSDPRPMYRRRTGRLLCPSGS